MERNLWGNLEGLIDGIKNPKEIFEEQADYLKEHFDGLVSCDIYEFNFTEGWKSYYSDLGVESSFGYSFELHSDYVAKYSYEICTFAYGIKMYPLAISFEEEMGNVLRDKFEVMTEDTVVVNDEKELCLALERMLSSKEVRQVLRGLLTIAKKEREESPF